MTEKELNAARELKKLIQDREQRLIGLRASAQNLVPANDGQPRSQTPSSRVEKLAIKILDADEKLNCLRRQFDEAAAQIALEIYNADLTAQEQAVLIARYVDCVTFRAIQFRLHLSDAHVFYLHRCACKKIKVG